MYKEKMHAFEKQPSEAVYHTRQHMANKMTGMEQKAEDKRKGKEMQEIFHMENAFGDISMGVNEKKEFAFVVDRKKYWNGPIASREEKALNRQRSSTWNNRLGYMELNRGDKQNSAYAFLLNKGWASEKKLIQETGEFSKKMQQETISAMLPFQSEKSRSAKSAALLQKLTGDIGRAMRNAQKTPTGADEKRKITGEFNGAVWKKPAGRKEQDDDKNENIP